MTMKLRHPAALAGTSVLLALCAGAPASAGVYETLFGRGATAAAEAPADGAAATRRQWQLSEFTALRLAPREASVVPNQHPQAIPAEQVRAWLQGVVLQRGGRGEALFGSDELAALPSVIAEALAAAKPEDDVLLLSTSRREGGLLGTPYGLTARLFVQGGALQLIVRDARLDFYNQYRGAGIRPEFRYGSRQVAGEVRVSSPQAGMARADWLAFALGAPPQTAASVQPPAPPPPVVSGSGGTDAGADRDARFYEAQEQRLRSLRRLREQDLITEDEYRAKRQQILQAL